MLSSLEHGNGSNKTANGTEGRRSGLPRPIVAGLGGRSSGRGTSAAGRGRRRDASAATRGSGRLGRAGYRRGESRHAEPAAERAGEVDGYLLVSGIAPVGKAARDARDELLAAADALGVAAAGANAVLKVGVHALLCAWREVLGDGDGGHG